MRGSSATVRHRLADAEIAVADAVDESAVRRALEGVDVAYYLIHSLGAAA